MTEKLKVTILGFICVALAVSCGKDVLDTSWTSTDQHFTDRMSQEEIENAKSPSAFRHPVWKGEKAYAQLLITSLEKIESLNVKVSDLKSEGDVISSADIETGFVRYVWGDVYANKYGQCGLRPRGQFDSLRVADLVDNCVSIDVEEDAVQPVWMTVHVPSDAKAGIYKGTVAVKGKGVKTERLPVELEVMDRTLPEASEWKFYLDLWQNPYSVARFHNVELWSREHFEHMRPVMEKLASAGQKVITATIIYRPWNGQTEDAFGSMVKKVKKADGNWEYSYEVFDRWVEWMMSIGIDGYINCYSMIPWSLAFDYCEEGSDEIKILNAAPGDEAYAEYWTPFIRDFEKHLKEKGWFEKTRIAMDERPVPAMLEAIKVIRTASPEMGISLAGGEHPEIEAELEDYCVAFRSAHPTPVEVRRERGQISTWYTCCAEKYPNTFTVSPISEAAWIGWRTLAVDYDGYLRWAVNSWTANPLTDTRFRSWCAGDTYMLYPDGRSSLRFDKMLEGIQDYEKMRILIDEWTAAGETDKVSRLEEYLKRFDFEHLSAAEDSEGGVGAEAAEAVHTGRNLYNSLSL